jgi:acetyl-CoA carboxylase biotin carboxyl carrier protein
VADPAAPIGVVSAPPPAAAPVPTEQSSEFTVTAPLIGVFYRSARQGEPPLVAPGDRVAADQPLGLIEVMKPFHEVTAGRTARVVAIHAADATPVEYGAALFTLSPIESAQPVALFGSYIDDRPQVIHSG